MPPLKNSSGKQSRQMQGGREKCSREMICTGNQSLLAEEEGQKQKG